MTRSDLVFRVFVSSTFSDLVEERNVLQAATVPRLERYCRERGASFQAIDLRWGVSGEASLDQQAMNLCLSEIRRCQRLSPRPNFLVLLGQRYGWLPPPPQVPADVFERLLSAATADERVLVTAWYRLDENAHPSEYVLQPRDPDGLYADGTSWQPIEAALQQALCRGARGAGLSGDRLLAFCGSATHQEIAAGALRVDAPADKVICVFRDIEAPPDARGIEAFVDADGAPVDGLKRELAALVPGANIVRCTARWSQDGRQPTRDHLARLAEDVYETLRRQIERELEAPTGAGIDGASPVPPDLALDREGFAHQQVAGRHLARFVGRDDVLAETGRYLTATERRLLVVAGDGGTGKSAVMSKVIDQARTLVPHARLVYRFIGATPASSSGAGLLRGLSLEICRRYGVEAGGPPQSVDEAICDFRERLAHATAAAPLVLVVDGLDQLPPDDPAERLTWLPFEPPAHVRFVVSTRPADHVLAALRARHAITLDLRGMERVEGESLLDLWLQDAGRRLQPAQRREVLDRFAASGSRPLYLRLAFEEAQQWRSWEAPGSLAPGIEGIIRRNLFARLAHGRQHGPALVSHALGLLAASRYGLADDEMCAILSRDPVVYGAFLRSAFHLPPDILACAASVLRAHGEDASAPAAATWLDGVRHDENRLRPFLEEALTGDEGPRLPAVVWTRLLGDLEPYLTRRSTEGPPLLGFYHRELADASAAEYLAPARRTLHGGLADYFERQDSWRTDGGGDTAPNPRKAAELPWQLLKAELWERLHAVLTDLDFLRSKCVAGGSHDLRADYLRTASAWPGVRTECATDAAETGSRRSLDEIVAWQRFVDATAERLASQEEPAVQIAVNWADGDPVARKIENRVATATGPTRPWARLLNRPPSVQRRALRRTLKGHAGPVTTLAVSRDGSSAISTGEDGVALLWDVGTGASRLVLDSVRGPTTATPDLGRLLTAANGTLDLWDTSTSARLTTIAMDGSVDAVAVTGDAAQALTAGQDGVVAHWDLRAARRLRVLLGHTKRVVALATGGDGTRALSGGDDRVLRVWDLRTGECVRVMKGHTAAVTAVAMSPDGTRALSGGRDNRVRVWDLDRGTCMAVLEEHTSSVLTVALSQDGRRAASGGWDQVLRVWDLQNASCVRAFTGHSQWIRSVALAPNGLSVLSAGDDQSIRVWDLEGDRQEDGSAPCAEITRLAPVPDSRHVVSANADRTLAAWDRETGRLVRTLRGHTDRISAVVACPDGRRAVSASYDRTVRVWDLESGQCQHVLSGHEHWVFDVAVTPDGRRAVSISGDKTLRVWDLDQGRCLHALARHTEWVSALVITPDGRHVVSASFDRTLRVWDLVTAACTGTLEGHSDLVYRLAMSPDGAAVFSAGDDRTIRVWDLRSGECVRVLTGHEGKIRWLTVTPDGRRLLSSGADATRLWDLSSGSCTQTWPGLVGAVTPDGRFAAVTGGGEGPRLHDLHTLAGVAAYVSVSGGQALRLRDLDSGRPVATYVSPGGDVGAVTFVGSRLVAGTASGRIDVVAIEGVERFDDRPRTTPARVFQFGDAPDARCRADALTALCPSCLRRFVLDAAAIEAIEAIVPGTGEPGSHLPCLAVPQAAWHDPRLEARCSHCGRAVWLNPFAAMALPREDPAPPVATPLTVRENQSAAGPPPDSDTRTRQRRVGLLDRLSRRRRVELAASLRLAADRGDADAVASLLAGGAPVDEPDEHRWTALLYAARGGHAAILDALLSRRADGNARNVDGSTALMYAVEGNHEPAVALLVDRGCDVRVQNRHGATALLLAAERGNVAIVSRLLDRGAAVNAANPFNGMTPLLCATEGGHLAVAERLLSAGARVDARNKDGTTPLMYAALIGNLELATLLLDRGADVSAEDDRGVSPIVLCLPAHRHVAKLLLARGAEVDPDMKHAIETDAQVVGFFIGRR